MPTNYKLGIRTEYEVPHHGVRGDLKGHHMPLWVANQVTTCTGRGHIVAAPLQDAQLVILLVLLLLLLLLLVTASSYVVVRGRRRCRRRRLSIAVTFHLGHYSLRHSVLGDRPIQCSEAA